MLVEGPIEARNLLRDLFVLKGQERIEVKGNLKFAIIYLENDTLYKIIEKSIKADNFQINIPFKNKKKFLKSWKF